MPGPQEIIENLRRASVQHGAALKELREDVPAMANDLKALMQWKASAEKLIADLISDVQEMAAALNAGPDDGGGEASDNYAAEEEEEDAEYEEAGG